MFKHFSDFYYKPTIITILKHILPELGILSGISQSHRKSDIVVSLSSIPENFDNLDLTIYSIMNQTVKPNKIILWLREEYNLSELPYNITKYVKCGLEYTQT